MWGRKRSKRGGTTEGVVESTGRVGNQRREDGIDGERMKSTKRGWNRWREGGIDEERMESTERGRNLKVKST
ncbi:hypothetical protein [Alkalicoccobacillus gibsonii]|uniref:hypothetical protein n=1 Tax=Alkalicoccobacillus gibsonii TaxID=79881 RepID=UPI003511B772